MNFVTFRPSLSARLVHASNFFNLSFSLTWKSLCVLLTLWKFSFDDSTDHKSDFALDISKWM